MKNRPTRFGLALLLLAVAWPPVAHLVAAILALVAAHPAVALTVCAAVLLLGSVPGPVERALTRLAGARTVTGGGKR